MSGTSAIGLWGDFERAIGEADSRLFDAIPAELTPNDRISLLNCQRVLRSLIPNYVYLEIGSYLGGSIQPCLHDPRCRHIIAIDSRPDFQNDERGVRFSYAGTLTQHMLDRLARLAPDQVSKVTAIECDTADLDPTQITMAPHFCFIDGEHTDIAALRDFIFCRRVSHADSLIIFHDAPIIYNALARIMEELNSANADVRAYQLPDTLFVIECNKLTLLGDPGIRNLATNNHVGYLHALRLNDGYRRFATLLPFRLLRRAARLVGLSRWADQHEYGWRPFYRRDS